MHPVWPRLAGVVLVALGCSGKTTTGAGPTPSPDGGSPPVAQADFAATYAQTLCSVLGKCCVAAGVAFDAQTCPQLAEPPTAGTRSVYDPVRAGECIALIRGMGDDCTMTAALSDQIQKACEWVYGGRQAIGQSCGSDRDCAGSYDGVTMCSVELQDGGLVSTCRAVELGNAGDQCDALRTCAAGLYCNEQSSVCAAVIPAGQPCAYARPGCADGLMCSVGGTCSPKLANGTACLLDSDCQSATCYRDRCAASIPFTAGSCAVQSSTP